MWEMSKKSKRLALTIFALNKRKVSAYSQKNQLSNNAGFTLIELLIAIAILSIIVAVAVPTYSDYIQRSKTAEALATLGNLSTQMEKNYLDFRKYTDNNGACAVSSPVSQNFKYSCVSSGQNYTWTATSNDGSYKFSVNNNFDKATLAFGGSTMSSVDCWMISKDGTCF